MKRSSDGSACACALLTKANMKLIPAIRHLLGAFSLPLVIAGLSTLASCATQKSSVALGSNGTDIVNHPEHHIGDHVTIRGKVKNVYSHGSFTVGPEGFLKLDLPVLARGPETSVPPLHEGDRVEIEGVVRTFTQRDFLGGYSTGFYGTGPRLLWHWIRLPDDGRILRFGNTGSLSRLLRRLGRSADDHRASGGKALMILALMIARTAHGARPDAVPA
jgi:hypothetical protein